jgi:hypothetical protein
MHVPVANQGPMLWIFKYFRQKNGEKIGILDLKQS